MFGSLCFVFLLVLCVTSRQGPNDCNPDHGYWQPELNRCICHDCYSGENCDTISNPISCNVDVGAGTTDMYMEFWTPRRDDPNLTTQIPIDFRMQYQSSALLSPSMRGSDESFGALLYNAICDLHEHMGNLNCDGKYIVLGTGSRQLFWAIRNAMEDIQQGQPKAAFVQTPYYFFYPVGFQAFGEGGWNPSYDQMGPQTVEVLTHPNNPDSRERLTPYYANTALAIHDLVYYWPMICAEACPNRPYLDMLDEEVMVYSMSKLTGHAGSMVGYAFFKSGAVAAATYQWLYNSNLISSIDAQYRTFSIINNLVRNNFSLGDEMFNYLTAEMDRRWNVILQTLENNPTDLFWMDGATHGAYLWMACDPVMACHNTGASYFAQNGLSVMSGNSFGEQNHFRINLTIFTDTFDLLMQKLARLLQTPHPRITPL